ncbi:MAG: hypothetical protein QNI87_06655 [Erythrobacter sp.]|uniref:hypothetical protein n=1 Tax=Erythrobacter sp. TaxID=1042 RepID=UPI002609CCA8|nr:hypothetical protein [Erythrobacter sp.]MDJ0978197.1 hypothetical protein [Erythrobacter sp.]
MRSSSLVVLTCVALTLSACAGGQARRGPPTKVINRVLATAPGAAQPSVIVKTEIAYFKAAQAQGQYSAGVEFGTPEAVLHGRNGPVPFATLAQALPNPDKATEWGPRTVVMSCDGALALSQGRFRDADGLVGNYVTAWLRQKDNTYKWSYDVAGRDNPQPPPRPEFEDGDIVVTAISSIRGLVATCPQSGLGVPPPPPMAIGEDGKSQAQLSSDGTLRWQWEHRADGTKYVKAEYFYEGAWETAIEESLESPS